MGFQVEIFGQTYTLRADADEEHVRRVAELVDQKMREVAGSSRSVSTLQIAVLAAMDIASDCLESQAEAARMKEDVNNRSGTLIARIAETVPDVEM